MLKYRGRQWDYTVTPKFKLLAKVGDNPCPSLNLLCISENYISWAPDPIAPRYFGLGRLWWKTGRQNWAEGRASLFLLSASYGISSIAPAQILL